MDSNYGLHDIKTNDLTYRPLIRGEFKKMNLGHVINLVHSLNKSSTEINKIQNIVVEFTDNSKMEISITEAKDLLQQLKNPIKELNRPELLELFQQAHKQVKAQEKQNIPAAVSLEVHHLPFIGTKQAQQVGELIENEKPGTYVVARAEKEYGVPEWTIGSTYVGFAQKSAGPFIYALDLLTDGTYKLRGRNENYNSIEAFIENRRGPPNYRLKEPLAISEPFSTVEETKKMLSSGLPYFEGMTYERALLLIEASRPGTYLFCDRLKDTDGKVIVYKNANGEVHADVLTLKPGVLQGYECNGKFIPSFNDYISANGKYGSKNLILPYKKPAELLLAEREIQKSRATTAQIEVTPTWKHDTYNQYRRELENDPTQIDALMQKACREGEFAVMKWLYVQHKAAFPQKEGLTQEQARQIDWLQKLHDMPPVSADDAYLNYEALTIGRGYKTANLSVQEFHVENINKELKVAKVEVPAKQPFSDFEMRDHLKPIMGELENDWGTFLATFKSDDILRMQKEDFNPIATPIQISPEGQVILDKMQEKIALHFRQFPFHTPELEDWIKDNPSEFYIVRSTGREDTKDNPNPGGNETIPNVNADPLAMSIAIGEVLKSYCGLKSVTQRLMVGDKGLFTEPLFLPVLLMKQVSERVNAAGSTPDTIPRSGVMFTRQEGKAEGHTTVQVGHGACDGIVGSKVGVDTYNIDSQLTVHSTIREKNTRYVPVQLIPDGPVKLSPVKTTDASLAKNPALSKAEAQDMKRVADYFSKAYGKDGLPAAMDMEFTITHDDQGKPTINLLQIRPLNEKQALDPSYLSIEKLNTIPEQNKVSVHALLGGRASVENLSTSKEVMFADNLSQALSRYLQTASGSFKTGIVEKPQERTIVPKVIFTRQASHLTSHEAIFFRNRGVVIFVVEDQATKEQVMGIIAKASEECPVKVCSQRGIIVDTHGIDAAALSVKGFVSYPIPLEVSIPPNPMLDRKTPLTREELSTVIDEVNLRFESLQEKLLGGGEFITNVTKSDLLDIAATATDPIVAKRAIATLITAMNNEFRERLSSDRSVGPTLRLELLHVFDTALKMVETELLPALNTTAVDFVSPEGHMNKLYHLKFLEALIGQKKQEGIVDGTSWKQLLRAWQREKTAAGHGVEISENAILLKKLEELGAKPSFIEGLAAGRGIDLEVIRGEIPISERANLLKTIANLGANSTVRSEWLKFVNDLATLKDPYYLEKAIELVVDLTRLGVTTTWMNLIFHDSAKNGGNAQSVLLQLLESHRANAENINWARDRLEKFSELRLQINEWSNPEFTRRNIQALRDDYTNILEMIDPGQKPQFFAHFESGDKLGKLVLIEKLKEAVDIYDRTIKAVTASDEYPEDGQLKAQHFTSLLVGYLRLLEGAYRVFTPKQEAELIKHGWDNKPLGFAEIINYFEHGYRTMSIGLVGLLDKVNDSQTDFSKLLQAGPEFKAEPFIPGARVDLMFEIKWPDTTEELFTTIHQSLEGVCRHLLVQTAGDPLLNKDDPLLEGRIKSIAGIIREMTGRDVSHFAMEGSKLDFTFQIPLRQHSCSISLKTDLAHPERGIVLKGEAFGNEEHDRWQQTATYGAFLASIKGREQPAGAVPAINYDDPRGVAFTIKLPCEGIGQKKKDKEWNSDAESLIRSVNFLFSNLSYNDYDTSQIVDQLSKIVGNDWTQVDSKFFSQSPYIAINLMNKFANEKNNELLMKAAAGSLESLVTYGLDDYVNTDSESLPKEFKSDGRFASVPGIQENKGQSLKVAATCYLLKMINENPDMDFSPIQKVIRNPELKNKLPGIVEVLEKAIIPSLIKT